MSKIVDGLREYLENTPAEQVKADWDELEHLDKVEFSPAEVEHSFETYEGRKKTFDEWARKLVSGEMKYVEFRDLILVHLAGKDS